MKAAKRSSIRTTASSKRKGTVRRKSSARQPANTSAAHSSQTTPAKVRYLTSGGSSTGPEKTSRVRIPPILLEGDTPGTPSPLEPAVTARATAQTTEVTTTVRELPEAYGTKRLKLTPRDPHWIHAHWDFTRQQLRDANARSGDGHLVLRLFKQSPEGPLISENHVHPESVRWLLHTPQAATPYAAELGFYTKERQWSGLAAAEPVLTPPGGPSADQGFEVATLSAEGTLRRHDTLKTFKPPKGLLGAGCALDGNTLNSAGLAEGSPGVIAAAPSSFGISACSAATGPSSFSSPTGGAPESVFRLEVNAELIVHGATEPNAMLQIGDQTVALDADGTFRFRFALPDGAHVLPVKSTAAGTGEQRTATMRFTRETDTDGPLGIAPQAPELKLSAEENL